MDPATRQGLALHVALRTRSDSTCSDIAVLFAHPCTCAHGCGGFIVITSHHVPRVVVRVSWAARAAPGKSPTRKSILGRTTTTSPGPLRDVEYRDAAVVEVEEQPIQVREHGLGRNGLQHALAILRRLLCLVTCVAWTSERDRFGIMATSSSATIERAMCWGALSLRMTVRCMLGLSA